MAADYFSVEGFVSDASWFGSVSASHHGLNLMSQYMFHSSTFISGCLLISSKPFLKSQDCKTNSDTIKTVSKWIRTVGSSLIPE